jgi:hypothetical protein
MAPDTESQAENPQDDLPRSTQRAIDRYLLRRVVAIGALFGIASAGTAYTAYRSAIEEASRAAADGALASVEAEIKERKQVIDGLLDGAVGSLAASIEAAGELGGRVGALNERVDSAREQIAGLEAVDAIRLQDVAELVNANRSELEPLLDGRQLRSDIAQVMERVSQLSADVPIGTVIASMLPPDQLDKNFNGGANFAPDRAAWLPADGRSAPNSRLAKLGLRVPDLRGTFIRGLPRFDEAPGQGQRAAGEAQEAAVAGHTHFVIGDDESRLNSDGTTPEASFGSEREYLSRANRGNSPGDRSAYLLFSTDKVPTLGRTSISPGEETRPANVAIYFLVRAN